MRLVHPHERVEPGGQGETRHLGTDAVGGQIGDAGGQMAASVVLDQQGSDEAGQPAGLLQSREDVRLFERLVIALDVGLDERGRRGRRRDRHRLAGRDPSADLAVGEQDPLEYPVIDHQVLGRWDSGSGRGRRRERVDPDRGARTHRRGRADRAGRDQRPPAEPPIAMHGGLVTRSLSASGAVTVGPADRARQLVRTAA